MDSSVHKWPSITVICGVFVALRRKLVLAVMATMAVLGGSLALAGAATFTWSQASEISVTPPPNAGGEPNAFFTWGACPTTSFCVGVGEYTDNAGHKEAMTAARTNGTWGPASEITLPSNAASNPEAGFGYFSGACTQSGSCAAIGSYTDSSGERDLMATDETSGSWGPASEIALPANAASNPEARVSSPACPPSGSCVAVGTYTDSSGGRQVMVAEETGGSWSQASEIALPANALGVGGSAFLQPACPASGSCVAVGEYLDSSSQWHAVAATETGGSWGPASEIALPANASSSPYASLRPACPTSGSCVAVGSYWTTGGHEAMVATESGGSWGPASELVLPGNAAGGRADLTSVACQATGSCFAVGSYLDASGNFQAMVAEETGGSWGQASEIAAPANAASNPEARVSSPACPPSGSCVAVGTYLDSSGYTQMMVADETGGSWGQASEIAAPANAESNPSVAIGPVECPASWSCTAFALYKSGGKSEDMEVNGMTAPENTVAPIVSGTAKVGQALACSQGAWSASPTSYAYKWLRDGGAIGGQTEATYVVQEADEGHALSCEVTATNSAGSTSATSGGVSVPVLKPANTQAPDLTGTTAAGQTLSCSQGQWANPVASYTYRWLRDGGAIGGQTEATYVVQEADEGHALSCEVTATNSAGSASATSNALPVPTTTTTTTPTKTTTLVSPPTTETTLPAGNLTLASTTVTTQSNGTASVALSCAGTSTCSGTLTLTATEGSAHASAAKARRGGKGKKRRSGTTTIGTAHFTIAPGKTTTITVKLNAAGRALLKAHHGHLNATLTISESSSGSTSTKHETIHLVQKTTRHHSKKRGK